MKVWKASQGKAEPECIREDGMVVSEGAERSAERARWWAELARSPGRMKIGFKPGSIATHIGLVYTLLASANLLFFLVMIHENQADILLQLFRSRTDALIGEVTRDVQKHVRKGSTDFLLEKIGSDLSRYDARSLVLLNSKGDILEATPPVPANEVGLLARRLKDEIVQLSRSESLLETGSLAHLDEKDFSVRFLIPLEADGKRFFVSATLSVSTMRERLQQMYVQAGIALAWVFVFHVGFAVYLFRRVIRRVAFLKAASSRLADGDLTARALWRYSGDELDELGGTFNRMADNIQSHVATIQTLNNQIQKELRIGKTVQALIINNRPRMEAYQPFILVRPLREVSGDVLKFYELPSGLKAMFFGDACGHGVSAALITSLTMNILDRLVHDVLHPAKVLRRLANELNASLDGMYFSTAVFLVLDEQRRRLYICNAGHIPPVILRPSNGSSVVVEASGPPAGTVKDFEYTAHVVDLKPGDRIAICSDGIAEAMGADRQPFGFERWISLLLAVKDLPTQEAGGRILRTVERFAPAFHDDATVILLDVP